MSLKPPQLAPILPDLKQNWTDLNKDGRRLDWCVKKCFTEFKRKENNTDTKFAYLDRMIKATLAKERLAITVLGVRQAIQEANKR